MASKFKLDAREGETKMPNLRTSTDGTRTANGHIPTHLEIYRRMLEQRNQRFSAIARPAAQLKLSERPKIRSNP
ncbi:MAG: hypothetical protein KGH94_02845 [Candidatus Micrarchaeota archaeon]|nr:hypothetical protein [Candidatus Micrarchaeota archaeon]